MKILIVSDTHRKDDNLKLVIEQNLPLDMLIHLGDVEGSEYQIPQWVNPECEMQMVMGNNDFFSRLDREREIDICGHRVLLTHGHSYGVSMGPEGLAEEAKSRGCDVAMFGHTHRPSYLLLTAQADGTLDFSQKDLRNYGGPAGTGAGPGPEKKCEKQLTRKKSWFIITLAL